MSREVKQIISCFRLRKLSYALGQRTKIDGNENGIKRSKSPKTRDDKSYRCDAENRGHLRKIPKRQSTRSSRSVVFLSDRSRCPSEHGQRSSERGKRRTRNTCNRWTNNVTV